MGLTTEEVVELALKLSALEALGIHLKIEGEWKQYSGHVLLACSKCHIFPLSIFFMNVENKLVYCNETLKKYIYCVCKDVLSVFILYYSAIY